MIEVTWVEALGFAAFLSNVAGNLMLAWQTIWGWVVRIVAIVLWGLYAYDTADVPLITNALTFFCINVFGLWKWRRERALNHGKPTYDELQVSLFEVTGVAHDLVAKYNVKHEIVYIERARSLLDRLGRSVIPRLCRVCRQPSGGREVCANHDC